MKKEFGCVVNTGMIVQLVGPADLLTVTEML